MVKIKHVLILISFLLIIGLVYLFVSNKKSKTYPNANVILIVVDTLRADHLGCYGYTRHTSPGIDRLANEGIIFKNMLAQSSWTRAGTASILAGLYPRNHGANTRNDSLAEEINLLPEILGKYGYDSYAFVANGNVGSAVGFNQGYKKFFRFRERIKEDPVNIHVRSNLVNETLLKFIQQLEHTSNNFIYVHYVDPHAPYIPGEKHFSKDNKMTFTIDFFRSMANRPLSGDERRNALPEMINAYDDEILYNDKMIGHLIQTLKEKNMYSNSIIIITSDHGEEFYEHGGLSHGKTLYEEQLKVPLIIRLPGNIHKTIDEIANQVDIVPTILSLLKISIPEHIDGISLLNNKSRPGPYSYAELHLDRNIFSSIQSTKEKLIEGIQLTKQKKRKYKWFRERATIETADASLELVIRSFNKKRTIQVLLQEKLIDQFVITHKRRKKLKIRLPKSPGKRIVTIKSLTPCQVPAEIGKDKGRRCLAFCIFNSRNIKVKKIPDEPYREYYLLAKDPGEKNNLYTQKQFMNTILMLRKKMKKFLTGKRFTPANKKKIRFDKEQLEALKALGYIQ
jgi:membrane-anchored protein YejM (alkaline phosphatase superfamily)